MKRREGTNAAPLPSRKYFVTLEVRDTPVQGELYLTLKGIKEMIARCPKEAGVRFRDIQVKKEKGGSRNAIVE